MLAAALKGQDIQPQLLSRENKTSLNGLGMCLLYFFSLNLSI